jgi:hypothetical protein
MVCISEARLALAQVASFASWSYYIYWLGGTLPAALMSPGTKFEFSGLGILLA